MTIQNRCTNCGGELLYNFDAKSLKCVQCGDQVEIPCEKASSTKNVFNPTSTIKNVRNKEINFKCENCGKIFVYNTNKKTLECPNCASPNVNATSEIEYIPDGIIPFTLNKKEAINSFIGWLKKKKFLPKNLKKQVSQCVFSPIYYPIYNYDFDCFSSYSGVGINYSEDANRNKIETRTPFNGTKQNSFYNYAQSANNSLLTPSLKSFGNYNYQNLYVFRTEYLYGITSVGVNLDLQNGCGMAKNNIEDTIERNIKSSYRFDEIKNFVCKTNFNKISYHYLYVPVWVHTFNYNNSSYSVFINGTTGKVSGKVPRSISKILLTILGIFLCSSLISLLIYLLCK